MSLMNCDQCEQTFRGTACVDRGVCGKDPDVESAQKILLYGLKGMAAYKNHARRLGKTDSEVEAFIEEALFATMTNVNFDLESLVEMVLECGRMNLKTMKLLNDAHVEMLGLPEPTEVVEGIQEGPGILVTGHDMADLKLLLEQTQGSGVNVYTHGEMLPAHSYPELKKYTHLKGHYGTAWQKQRLEFEQFGGPVLGTTNCVLIPWDSNTYLDRLYTTRATAIPDATRITDDNFAALIEHAREIGPLKTTETKVSTVGFHYTQILSHADTLVKAFKSGEIKRVFLIGGCDGAEPGRNYYTEFAQNTPQDSLILTLGCGKFRIRDHDYGTVAGLPRFLDMGQCNDAYGAIQVALALAEAFECGVNDLPITYMVSWFEQKAVAVLLTLLHLNVQGINLGPNLPAFVSPNVLELLQKNFDLKGVGKDAKADMEALLVGV